MLSSETPFDNLSNVELPEVEDIAEREWQNYLANLALDKIRKEVASLPICFAPTQI